LNKKNPVTYYLILSASGAALIMLLSLSGSPNIKTIQMSDKLVIGIAFILSCMSGICVAIKPNLTKRLPKRSSHDRQPIQTIELRGHHPECEHFKSHIIKIRDKILCPGCSGLAMGSIISITLMSFYIVFLKEIPQAILPILIILGIVLIAFSYIEIVIPTRKTYLHLISNIFLVISFLLIIIGIFHLTGSVIYGLFAVLISFLWLDTRIQLSNWHHSRVCKNCSETCKVFRA
jgi:hypothetical protein